MVRIGIFALTGLAAAAFAHNDAVHITVDTDAGGAGDKIHIVTGWHEDEEHYSFGDDGYLMHEDQIHTFFLDEVFHEEPWHDRNFSEGPRLTSDHFFPTGRLDGGDFAFEIVKVTPVGVDDAVFGWADFHHDEGVLENVAESNGGSREARSYGVGINQHSHHQIQSLDTLGRFDVTLVAWDKNGRYLDSDPVIIRFRAIPTPGTGAALVLAGVMAGARRRRG